MPPSETLVRTVRSSGEILAIGRQLARCAEDVTELTKADPLLAPEGAALNDLLLEATEVAQSMMAALNARLDNLE